jgi:hypothetical protein
VFRGLAELKDERAIPMPLDTTAYGGPLQARSAAMRALPPVRIEVQNRASLVNEVGITRKIQSLGCHGLMVSVSRSRHTVLRLIGVPSTLRTQALTSARDCRLSGCGVSATSAQATALTEAWSRGEKSALRPCPGLPSSRSVW